MYICINVCIYVHTWHSVASCLAQTATRPIHRHYTPHTYTLHYSTVLTYKAPKREAAHSVT